MRLGQNDMPTLIEYIKEYRSQGYSDEEIRELFVEEYGDDPAAVDEAFARLAEQEKSKKPKWFWPVAIGATAIGAIALFAGGKKRSPRRLSRSLGSSSATHERWVKGLLKQAEGLIDETRHHLENKDCDDAFDSFRRAIGTTRKLESHAVSMDPDRIRGYLHKLSLLDQRLQNTEKRFNHRCKVTIRNY